MARLICLCSAKRLKTPGSRQSAFLPSVASGARHPESALAGLRSADARSRERDTPEGVTQGLHVSLYKVDPRINVAARNLLSKDD